MPQVRIELDETLYAVLEQVAEEECRLPTLQATWIVRQALRERLKFDTALRHLERSETSTTSQAILVPVAPTTMPEPVQE